MSDVARIPLPLIGKTLRKLRIDCDETLEEMAARLTLAPAVLDAIETGKEQAPVLFETAVIKEYKLDSSDGIDLVHAADMSRSVFEFYPKTELQKKFLGDLSRSFNRITNEGFQHFRNMMKPDPIQELLARTRA